MAETRDNSGILFKNDRKTEEKHPYYKGYLTVAGVEYYVSGWIKQGQKGKFIGLAVTPKEQKQQNTVQNPADDDGWGAL